MSKQRRWAEHSENCTGVVRAWDDEAGWGVIDSPQTPGGCWAHWSAVHVDGFTTLAAGDRVTLRWENAPQDGYAYRAVAVTGTADPRP